MHLWRLLSWVFRVLTQLVLQIETWTYMFIYKNSQVGSYILLQLCFVTIARSIKIAL